MGLQNSCKTLIGVHSTMHLMHIKSYNYYLKPIGYCVCCFVAKFHYHKPQHLKVLRGRGRERERERERERASSGWGMCYKIFVDCCLATKVFIDKLWAARGVWVILR